MNRETIAILALDSVLRIGKTLLNTIYCQEFQSCSANILAIVEVTPTTSAVTISRNVLRTSVRKVIRKKVFFYELLETWSNTVALSPSGLSG